MKLNRTQQQEPFTSKHKHTVMNSKQKPIKPCLVACMTSNL